jgi:hypothetical protein
MNVATLIQQLQKMAQPNDEVILIVNEPWSSGGETFSGVFTGKVIGTGTGAENGKCEVYGLS